MEEISEKKSKNPSKSFHINSKKVLIGLGLVGLVWVSATTSAAFTYLILQSKPDNAKPTSSQTYNVSDNTNVVGIVNQISKSVVNISTTSHTFNWFQGVTTTRGAGTGVIVRSDGYILTNNHVIDGADSITVTTRDGKDLTANVITTDPTKDLAVIKVKPDSKLTAAKLGDSSKIQVGEEVIAVGNVLGQYSYSVTKGIVSGLGRPISVGDSSGLRGNLQELDDLIQTDAAINAGNSGGPLVNMKGEVIGLNAAVDGSAQNIGFAVPINHATELMKSIK